MNLHLFLSTLDLGSPSSALPASFNCVCVPPQAENRTVHVVFFILFYFCSPLFPAMLAIAIANSLRRCPSRALGPPAQRDRGIHDMSDLRERISDRQSKKKVQENEGRGAEHSGFLGRRRIAGLGRERGGLLLRWGSRGGEDV